MNWINAIMAVICNKKQLPRWTHGLECEICQKSFVSPEAHLQEARINITINKHQGKIPVLRR